MSEVARKKEVTIALMFLTAFLVIVLDRITKVASFNNMSEGQSIPILQNVFHLTLVKNKGIAFGLFRDNLQLWSSLALSAMGLALVYVVYRRKNDYLTAVSSALIAGGTIGNLFDRVRFGHVIDFLDFRVWPVFNVADSSITIGAALLAWSIAVRSNIKNQISK